MRPGSLRNELGFVGVSAAALLAAAPAPAQASPLTATLVGNAPLTVALGAAAFAVLALLAFRKVVRDARAAADQAGRQIAGLRAELDEYEALLSGVREVTVLWTGQGDAPRIFGEVRQVLEPGRRPETLLDFAQWLDPASARGLAQAVEALRVRTESFARDARARDGRAVRIHGMIVGSGAALRIRIAEAVAPAPLGDDIEALLGGLAMPAFRRDVTGAIVFTNAAYEGLARRAGEALARAVAGPAPAAPRLTPLALPGSRFELAELPLPQGSVGYLLPQATPVPAPETPGTRDGHVAALVEALAIPAAIFDARHQLVAANRAYRVLWRFGDTLRLGTDERIILDRLRREGQLPAEPDYQGWRTRHLAAYGMAGPRTEPWHLPDGRTLNVTAAPAGPQGGVIYLFEDVSRELELMSQNRALASVQRSTLNALSDAVAVFGTNGRLQLFNPRLAALWNLDPEFLAQNPHIDQVAAAAAIRLPLDGATIWRDLKRAVIDLTPTRADSSGRLTRSDGKLLDYAVVRLPDGQKLMTFLDVTDSANYNQVLKERNDALVTADRLKDAFVQNVSYELRSPLTNIIGFADLLATPEVGPLNARQRAYTDYIRASSTTLGVLIDNILDLATVDAGIAELRPEPQDIRALVDKARAGLAATYPETGRGAALNLVLDIPPELPSFVADGTRIVQVLYNLLSSAARFSEPGGEVRLSVVPRGERLLFIVEDDGPISEERRAELAERPELAGPAGRERGTGLGLAIVRAFVNLHGGTIAVEPRRPRGTRVVVNLPRDASAIATTTAAE